MGNLLDLLLNAVGANAPRRLVLLLIVLAAVVTAVLVVT